MTKVYADFGQPEEVKKAVISLQVNQEKHSFSIAFFLKIHSIKSSSFFFNIILCGNVVYRVENIHIHTI